VLLVVGIVLWVVTIVVNRVTRRDSGSRDLSGVG
jgi:hypothetical protein